MDWQNLSVEFTKPMLDTLVSEKMVIYPFTLSYLVTLPPADRNLYLQVCIIFLYFYILYCFVIIIIIIIKF